MEYLSWTTLKLLKNPASRYSITDDFNKLPTDDISEQFGLNDMVNLSTRFDNKLDLTDINEYQPAHKLAPVADDDHCCILVKAREVTQIILYLLV